MLWQEYGEKLPGFDGDDALDALILHSIEARRAESERKKNENKYRNMNG